tara:strand:- start:6853 stop:7062 length:210 start_codon:yes stop_codon:yes gene_type:complete
MINSLKGLGIDLTAIVWTFSFATTIKDLSVSLELASFILGFIFLSVRFVVYIVKNRKHISAFFNLFKKK